jgi:AcrR family transcriptional regulator
MRKAAKRAISATQADLLDAACRTFAEKGYRDATIAEICQRAGANIAAVNYYFRDKETLYVEAWRLAFKRSLEAHPPDGGVPPDDGRHQLELVHSAFRPRLPQVLSCMSSAKVVVSALKLSHSFGPLVSRG